MSIFKGPQEVARDIEKTLAAEKPKVNGLPEDVKGLFKELCETYAEDLLDDPKGCVDSPEALKREVALLIKAGPYVGMDFKKMFTEHEGKAK